MSPQDAAKYDLAGFDGAVCDFLGDLSRCGDHREFNVTTDEFYAPIFARMKKTIEALEV